MFSYRHAFHAGNHADVLKHLVLTQLLDYMVQKDGAVMFVDTHAGGGIYSLGSPQASRNAEYQSGISRLWGRKDLPAPLARYVEAVRGYNTGDQLRSYPGSPFIAAKLLRPLDRLRLFELHHNESKVLVENMRKLDAHAPAGGRGKRVMVEREDGFTALKALLPPPSRRGLILIDPPYEDKMDYRRVKDVLDDALGRFPTGTYAIWYPLLQRMEARQLPERLKRMPGKDWLNVTLSISEASPDGFGLTGSGMFIINPPWTLEAELRELMPTLTTLLTAGPGANFVLESGAPVTGVGARRGRALPTQA
ncbi:23S rRNA (adenine(2030)-N(6))-methyltransferase RlmJ [Lacisediminimonas sp.]|uniref:23S rRNA (adenine(2030)-N(6))-methyltransferase RlmJ n=1 Tax=Lacisediminimonas sp. TaxID=3060582 RepID=UPI00271A9C53|nr:23S rRNA (adenine(2030)-N(6))-methyltransferase RlmJ [Lacisediminimonas sp.]MDO8298950.1 23S rRNA (adenine(2030)-N(6))-methyltransferase RlmJ [Lacisediminimonas sp.]MDO9216209.1 23S rRNA (adenine(2030)-N(6))-methyltransferase RlmJ [Lacisediminimonas sp.]